MNDSAWTFVDTNVLVYAYDVRAQEKHEIAREVVRNLWESGRGTLSTQVLQEFYVTVTRKLSRTLDSVEARRVIAVYRAWPVQMIDVPAVLGASEIAEGHQLSFWDGLIIEAARRAGASRVLSEDMQSGRVIAGIQVENPFSE